MKICKVDGCNRKYYSRGFCTKHYSRWLRHGDPYKTMDKTIDETNKRYGKLVVLEFMGLHPTRHLSMWRCKCDCGNEKVVCGRELRHGDTTSCGCYGGGRPALPIGEAALGHVLSQYKKGAKERDLEWKLSKNQFRELVRQRCFYCGKEPSQTVDRVDYNGVYPHNGIDRIDNNLGYVEGNVVPCCKHCNTAKLTRTPEEFIAHAKRIVEWQAKKK